MVAATKYTEDQILDAAATLIADAGLESVSVAAIARMVGAPSGSIYHRFASRKHLLGALWVRTTSLYAASLADTLKTSDLADLAGSIVNHTFDWVEAHPREATLLMRLRTEDFDAKDWPAEVVEAITNVNAALVETIVVVAIDHQIDPIDMTLAAIDVPASIARRSILLGDRALDSRLRHRATELVAHLLSATP